LVAAPVAVRRFPARTALKGETALTEDRRLRHTRVKEILFEASRLRGEAREAFLRSACGDDLGLLGEIESLLTYHDRGLDEANGKRPDSKSEKPTS
jgi:hypothetical protein